MADLRDVAIADLLRDKWRMRGVIHTIQVAVQAMLDVAFAIGSQEHLGEPQDNRQVFERLATAGWLSTAQRDLCRRMVSFRNVVVHQYLQVDDRIVVGIIERDLDDLLGFVRAIRARLPAPPPA